MQKDTLEACSGCGAIAAAHPIVGVTRDKEDSGKWATFPVCDACWRDPAHRTAPLKMHFFARPDAENALANAGKMNLGG